MKTTVKRDDATASLRARFEPTILLGPLGLLALAGCGPTFDPASLIESTRVLGARIEVEGAPERASPKAGETANVTWLVTSPEVTPPLAWAFVVCPPGTGAPSAACLAAPLVRFAGTDTPPRIAIAVPAEAVLGGASSLGIYGGICAGSEATPTFDAGTGLVICTPGGQSEPSSQSGQASRGTTVASSMPLQQGDAANHNPTAEGSFTFDGAAWPAPTAGGEPCADGPRVAAGSKGHLLAHAAQASDRERYTLVSPATGAVVPTRESLQISQFCTAGKLKSQFSFVEATDERASTTVEVTWDAPVAAELPASGAVAFTFVVRDDRGGTDATTRKVCVVP